MRELLVARRREVDEIVVSRARAPSKDIEAIVAIARERAIPVRAVPLEKFAELATSSSPQGVIARAEPIRGVELEELVVPHAEEEGNRHEASEPFLVVLAEVTDPQNLGAILRSALGAGVTGIVVGRHRSVRLTPAAMKAAAGAAEHLPIASVGSIAQAIVALSRRGVWTVGLDPDGETSVFGLEVADRPIALVAGAEGGGLPPLVRRRCDLCCRIPLYGPVDSLNVSVAVGIAAFAVATRRKLDERRK